MKSTVLRPLFVAALSVAAIASLSPARAAQTDEVSSDEVAAAATRPMAGKSVTFTHDYRDAPAKDVLLDIARTARLNVVMPGDLEGAVTAHFQRMPVMQAFAYVVSIANGDYRVLDGTITVAKRSVVIRPPAGAAKSGRMTPEEVERAARRIDEDDAELYRPHRTHVERTVRTETYVNGGYPAGYAYGGYGSSYPRATTYSIPSFNNGAYDATAPLDGNVHITTYPTATFGPAWSFYPYY